MYSFSAVLLTSIRVHVAFSDLTTVVMNGQAVYEVVVRFYQLKVIPAISIFIVLIASPYLSHIEEMFWQILMFLIDTDTAK